MQSGQERLHFSHQGQKKRKLSALLLLNPFLLCLLLFSFVPLAFLTSKTAHADTGGLALDDATLATMQQELGNYIKVSNPPVAPIGASAQQKALARLRRVNANVSLPAYNNVGTSNDSTPGAANFDGTKSGYSAQSLKGVGITPGQNVTVNGSVFTWPSSTVGTVDNYVVNGQVIPVTPVNNAVALTFLGAGSNGEGAGNVVITYTDGSTQTDSLGMSDWTFDNGNKTQPDYGNLIAATMAYHNAPSGKQNVKTYLFYNEIGLQTDKVVQSVTLPTSVDHGQMHIFAVSTRTAYNNVGVSDDTNPKLGNFDGGGVSYSAQALQKQAGITIGQPFTYNGITFNWPSPAPGTFNNYQSNGQTVPVVPVNNAATLGFLGASTSGTAGSASGTALISYTDGSTQSFTLALNDWTLDAGRNSLLPNNSIAASLSYRNTASGKQIVNTYLFYTEVALQAGKTIQSVQLPSSTTGGQLHVFAISTRDYAAVYNSVGVSDDTQATAGNFDGHGNSFSAQALKSVKVVPGQLFVDDGIEYTWPNVTSGQLDNYQTSGQTITVNSQVFNAVKIGFLGASVGGASTGAVTINYADGTSDTKNLTLSDWTLRAGVDKPAPGTDTSATMSYHNSATGKVTQNTYLFNAELDIPAGKIVQSVTLPSTTTGGQMHIFAVGTRSYFNNIGISDNGSLGFANLDGLGNSLSEQDFENKAVAGWYRGDILTYNGMSFQWPAVSVGQPDNYLAQGQTIPITAVAQSGMIGFLGTSTSGPSSGTATINYTDGSTQNFTLGLSDWTLQNFTKAPSFHNRSMATLPHRNTSSGQQTLRTFLFYTEQKLLSGKTVQSVTLPATTNQGQLHIFSIATQVAGGYTNGVAISPDTGTIFADYDHSGNSYSYQALRAAGIYPSGSTKSNFDLIYKGTEFNWINSWGIIPDNYEANGQVIAVTPVTNATSLAFLGSSTNGSASGTATMNFSDGTTQNFTLGLTDWANGTPAFNNEKVVTMSYRNSPTGKISSPTYIYYGATAIPAGKTLQSVTLPASVLPSTSQLHVLALGTQGDNAYNNAAISDDAGNHFANIDGGGKSLSYETLQYAGINTGQSVKANGVDFTWPAANPGYYDNYQANGQILPITPVNNASTLAFLGLSTNGSSAGTATITYTDGSTQNFTLSFTDWCKNSPQYGNVAIAVLPYHNTTAGKENGNCFIYYTETALQSNKTVQSVTLPNSLTQGTGQLHIFSVGTRAGSYYNNIGTVDDDHPTLGNFDGQNAAFSQQALQSVGIQPGQIVSKYGINFTWPNVLSDPNAADEPYASVSQYNNFVANGQTIGVTPVNNATTLGFLGASTGGNQSGQITMTYTDGSTQTATLNMTDWTNSVGKGQLATNNRYVATMSYRDIPKGKDTRTIYLYYTDVALTSGKILQSVTLPNQAGMHIFAIGTRGSSIYNSVGVADDAHPSFASLDQGPQATSYSAQALQQAGLTAGQPFTVNGVTFMWPAEAAGGQLDNYVANGQTIPVTPVDNANTIAFLGTGTNGAPTGTAIVNYADGSHQTITLGFTDWWATTPVNNNQIVATMPYLDRQTGKYTQTVHLYYVEYTLTSGKTVQSITLPQTVSAGLMHIFAISTRGTIFYNNASTSNDTNTKTGNFDGAGNSYSAQALKAVGVQPNSAVYYNGVTFTWANAAAGQYDNYTATGQTIPIVPSPNATTLGFIGATNAGPASGTATITYTDGSTQTFTLTMSDWTLGGGSGSVATGNQKIATMTYRNTQTGAQKINVYLFYTDVALQSGKTIQSITLPNQSKIHIFALGTRSASVYNNAGISTDGSTSFVNFDNVEDSLSASALQNAGFVPGAPVNVNGVSFTWPNAAFGQYDNYVASGQVIPVTPVSNATTLAFLGTATNGATSGTATITYTDGSTQTFTLGFTDWAKSTLSFGNTIAAVLPYYNVAGGQSNAARYLYYAEVSLNATKTVKSVTLPSPPTTGGQIHVFSVGTRSGLYYNNAGTSDDSNPSFGNYDGGGYSYSAQALKAAGIVPNQTFYFNGSTFVWPNEASGDYNNYTTNGQTIPVSTIANADTLAFIGSASITGSLSATATINYTDGSSQDFTLTMSDWTLDNGTVAVAPGDQIVTTLPYRNSATGKNTTKTYLFYTNVSLQAGKSVQSVKMPNAFSTGTMHIFAIGSRAVTQYNNVGINDDNNPGFSASLDGGSSSYSAEALQNQGLVPGQTFTYNGVDFTWPNTVGGQLDNYQANGQVIPVAPVAGATTLAFLGAGTNGSPTGTATITFTDGTTQNFTLQLTDWATSPTAYGNLVAATSTYYLNGMTQVSANRYVFYTDITIQPGETIQSIQLPTTVTTGQMHIFAIGTK